MNACRRVCGPTRLLIPARRATRRTIRDAACRSRRSPSEPQEDRALAAVSDREIDRAGGPGRKRNDDDLAALAENPQGAVAAFDAELFDVRTDRFGDPQPVECQQAQQRMVTGVAEPGRDQHGTDLVAVQAGRVRFVVEARPSNMHRG